MKKQIQFYCYVARGVADFGVYASLGTPYAEVEAQRLRFEAAYGYPVWVEVRYC